MPERSTDCIDTLPDVPDPDTALIFVMCKSEISLLYPLIRNSLPNLEPVESALTQLVRGTTPEERDRGLLVGFDSVDPADSDRIEVQTELNADGVLALDLILDGEPWHPGTLAGTSFQVFWFVDPIDATVFQFPKVTAIARGSLCWGELDCTRPFTRSMWETTVNLNPGRDVSAGCGALGSWFDPDCGSLLPSCGDDIEITATGEGATGSAVYYLEVSAPQPCFLTIEGTVTVLSATATPPTSTAHQSLSNRQG